MCIGRTRRWLGYGWSVRRLRLWYRSRTQCIDCRIDQASGGLVDDAGYRQTIGDVQSLEDEDCLLRSLAEERPLHFVARNGEFELREFAMQELYVVAVHFGGEVATL